MGVRHEAVEFGAGFFEAGYAMVDVFARNVPTTAPGALAELSELHSWILMAFGGTHPGVQCHAGDA
jgi:hypothetical protein